MTPEIHATRPTCSGAVSVSDKSSVGIKGPPTDQSNLWESLAEGPVELRARITRGSLRRVRVFWDRQNPFAFSDDYLYESYRFSSAYWALCGNSSVYFKFLQFPKLEELHYGFSPPAHFCNQWEMLKVQQKYHLPSRVECCTCTDWTIGCLCCFPWPLAPTVYKGGLFMI